MPLRALQEWFARGVMHAGPVTDAVDAADVSARVTDGPRLPAMGRLAIYHHAYRARLVECLADDFPTVRHALGPSEFEAVAAAYIAKHPSSSPSLTRFGALFPAFVGASSRFLADLAALEWALVEVVHAKLPVAFSLADLSQIPVERWAGARFSPSASVRLLAFEFPVNAYFQAVHDGGTPAIPDAAKTATVVHREASVLYRLDLSAPAATLLRDLLDGARLGDALGRLEAGTAEEARADLSSQVMAWFRGWVEGGFFAAMHLD